MKDEDCVKAIASSLRLFGDKSSILDKGVLKDVEGWESTQQKLMSWAKQHKNMYNICLFFFMNSVLSTEAASIYVRHKYSKNRYGKQNVPAADGVETGVYTKDAVEADGFTEMTMDELNPRQLEKYSRGMREVFVAIIQNVYERPSKLRALSRI